MRIAIPSVDNKGLESYVEEHFGRAKFYTFVDVDPKIKEIKDVRVLEVPFLEHGPGDIPNWIKENGADVVLALGMGPRAVDFFETLGVHVVTGVTGKISDVVRAYLEGTLQTIEWAGYGQHEGRHGHHH